MSHRCTRRCKSDWRSRDFPFSNSLVIVATTDQLIEASHGQQLHYYNRFFSEPNHNFLDRPATRKLKNARSQNARSQTAAILAAILATIIYCAIALPRARVVVDDITNEMPVQDTSLKWMKVTVSTQNSSHTFQEPSYSKKSTWNKTLTYLKPIFSVNPIINYINLKYCGYTILNTFAP